MSNGSVHVATGGTQASTLYLLYVYRTETILLYYTEDTVIRVELEAREGVLR